MPVFSRKDLRQLLGMSYTRDIVFSKVPSLATPAFMNAIFADSSLTGQSLYENASLRHITQTNIDADYRVSSFNTGSGAFVTSQLQVAFATLNVGDEFEVHSRLSALEKDRALDDTIKRIRVRQEVGISTGTGGPAFYSIESTTAPYRVVDVLDAYYFASPDGSMTRGQQRFDDIQIVTTGSGRELRISPALGSSQQIILDAILELTLNFGSQATINIPDDEWVLAGAAAKCYDLMIQNTPGQNAGELVNRRKEWAGRFSALSSRFAPYPYERKIRLGETDANQS